MSEFSTPEETTPTDAAEVARLLKAGEQQADEGPAQSDLFTVMGALSDCSVKDDMISMEYPLYALSKSPERRIREYSRGGKVLKVIPSVVGAPTIFDKDLMIYLISMVVDAQKRGEPVSRRIRMNVTSFLKGTERSTGGASYERVVEMCRRLRGVSFETNIKTTEQEKAQGVGLIAEYVVTSYTKNGKGALELEVLLSEWMWRAVSDFEVLTLKHGYFKLTQALERRVYELARKHCGKQGWWVVSLDILREKVGSEQSPRKWKQEVKAMVLSNHLPEYQIFLDESVKPNQVIFLNRDTDVVMSTAEKTDKVAWVGKVLQMRLH